MKERLNKEIHIPILQNLRGRIAAQGTWLLLFYILFFNGAVTVGLESSTLLYKVFALVSVGCVLLKIVSTEYTLREMLWIGILGVLIILSYLNAHLETMILTGLGIVAAKGVNIQKIIRIALWERILCTLVYLFLFVSGIFPWSYATLPKYIGGKKLYFDVLNFGFQQPNVGGLVFWSSCVLLLICYHDVLCKKKYIYYGLMVLLSGVMFGVYKILMCRSALVLWIVALCMLLLYELAGKKEQLRRLYMRLLLFIPVFTAAGSIVLVCLYSLEERPFGKLLKKLNKLTTNRISLASKVAGELPALPFGHKGKEFFDIAYIYLIYNYGWVFFILALCAYSIAMYRLLKKKQYLLVLLLAMWPIYGIMEMPVISLGWNTSLLLVSVALYGFAHPEVKEG